MTQTGKQQEDINNLHTHSKMTVTCLGGLQHASVHLYVAPKQNKSADFCLTEGHGKDMTVCSLHPSSARDNGFWLPERRPVKKSVYIG